MSCPTTVEPVTVNNEKKNCAGVKQKFLPHPHRYLHSGTLVSRRYHIPECPRHNYNPCIPGYSRTCNCWKGLCIWKIYLGSEHKLSYNIKLETSENSGTKWTWKTQTKMTDFNLKCRITKKSHFKHSVLILHDVTLIYIDDYDIMWVFFHFSKHIVIN